MFTGIVENLGIVKNIVDKNDIKTLWVECDFINELYVDQSVAHNGVCLTIEKIFNKHYQVTLIEETLKKTNFNHIENWRQIRRPFCSRTRGYNSHVNQ